MIPAELESSIVKAEEKVWMKGRKNVKRNKSSMNSFYEKILNVSPISQYTDKLKISFLYH